MLLEEDRVRLLHMVEAGEAVLEFVEGRVPGDLEKDTMLRFALVRAIEILGEAANNVSKEIRESTRSIPWSQIVAMRHRLAHAYFDINQEILWKTATLEVPRLLPEIRVLLAEE